MSTNNNEKKMAALEAVKFIREGMTLGLGTGSTAFYAIEAVGELVKRGMQLQCVPTSEQTRVLAEQRDIPIVDINSIEAIDITIDGADEFTQGLDLIKGGGGALLREKIVASLTRELIIITDSSKLVSELGLFKVPIEVIPFAASYVMRELRKLGGIGLIRQKEQHPYLTDQGNYIIDADFGLINDPATLDHRLNELVGLVEHGLFIGLAARVIMARQDDTVVFSR
ncbi:ribose 5-phosphate isomerase A [Niabella terrae]